jgi:hypothetical protein
LIIEIEIETQGKVFAKPGDGKFLDRDYGSGG